jgi:hypothetical protein
MHQQELHVLLSPIADGRRPLSDAGQGIHNRAGS